MERLAAKHGVVVTKGSKEYQWLQSDMTLVYLEYANEVLKYDDALLQYDLTSVKTDAVTYEPRNSNAMAISTLEQDYTIEKLRVDAWSPKTKIEKEDHFNLLKEILGADTDIASLTALSAKQMKDTLLRYPRNRNKNPLTRGKPLNEILGLSNTQVIQVTTINKYLQSYSDMFEWAKRNGHTNDNVFSGLTIRQSKKRVQTDRQAFTNEHVHLLYTAVTDDKQGLINKDYQKWGALIGLFSGARLNEIAQLQLDDIRQDAGIWYFDFNDDGDGKQLKTQAARRIVPVHQQLLDLGFLEYVNSLRAKGTAKLFPDFRYDPKNGWGRQLGRWFNERLLPALDLKSKELVFHSLRHTVVTRLMQKDVAEAVVKALVGHQQDGVTQNHYFKQGYTTDQLNNAMQKLDYDLPR